MTARVYWANATLAFLLELAALAALGYWGFTLDQPAWVNVLIGVGAPLLAALVWGLYAAPRARYHLPTPAIVAVKLLVFGTAAAALYAADRHVSAIILAALAAANTAAGTALPEPADHTPTAAGRRPTPES